MNYTDPEIDEGKRRRTINYFQPLSYSKITAVRGYGFPEKNCPNEPSVNRFDKKQRAFGTRCVANDYPSSVTESEIRKFLYSTS